MSFYLIGTRIKSSPESLTNLFHPNFQLLALKEEQKYRLPDGISTELWVFELSNNNIFYYSKQFYLNLPSFLTFFVSNPFSEQNFGK
jgi:hypothetical protein